MIRRLASREIGRKSRSGAAAYVWLMNALSRWLLVCCRGTTRFSCLGPFWDHIVVAWCGISHQRKTKTAILLTRVDYLRLVGRVEGRQRVRCRDRKQSDRYRCYDQGSFHGRSQLTTAGAFDRPKSLSGCYRKEVASLMRTYHAGQRPPGNKIIVFNTSIAGEGHRNR